MSQELKLQRHSQLFENGRAPYKGFDGNAMKVLGFYQSSIEALEKYAEKLLAGGGTLMEYVGKGNINDYCKGSKELSPHVEVSSDHYEMQLARHLEGGENI